MPNRPDPKDLLKVMSIGTVFSIIVSLLCILAGGSIYVVTVYIGMSPAAAWWSALGCSILCLAGQIIAIVVCIN